MQPAACAVGLDLSVAGRGATAACLERSLSCAQALGAPMLNLYCGPGPDADAGHPQAALADAVVSVADDALRRGIVIVLENELSPRSNVADSIDAWVGIACSVSSDAFKLTLDLANFVASGETDIFDKLGPAWPHVGHVHIKDIAPYSEETVRAYPDRKVFQGRGGRFVSVPVGEGVVENTRVLQHLLGLGYSGAVTIETFHDADSLGQAVRCIDRASAGPVGS